MLEDQMEAICKIITQTVYLNIHQFVHQHPNLT